jgi:uncharacterized membrane protein
MPLVLRRAFIAATLAWVGLLVLVPFLASRPHATTLGTALVVAVYGAASLVCHQLPARSYRLWHAQMPVCARCAGIYVGAAMAAVVRGARGCQPSVDAGVSDRSPERPALRRPSLVFRRRSFALHPRLSLALAALPTAATLLYEWTTGDAPSNALRFAAGLPIGAVVAWLVVSAATDQVN